MADVHPRRAKFDALDDGEGPYMESFLTPGPVPFWDDFKAWAERHLGQGFSLACCDGDIIDPTTRATFDGYRGGRKHG